MERHEEQQREEEYQTPSLSLRGGSGSALAWPGLVWSVNSRRGMCSNAGISNAAFRLLCRRVPHGQRTRVHAGFVIWTWVHSLSSQRRFAVLLCVCVCVCVCIFFNSYHSSETDHSAANRMGSTQGRVDDEGGEELLS